MSKGVLLGWSVGGWCGVTTTMTAFCNDIYNPYIFI